MFKREAKGSYAHFAVCIYIYFSSEQVSFATLLVTFGWATIDSLFFTRNPQIFVSTSKEFQRLIFLTIREPLMQRTTLVGL